MSDNDFLPEERHAGEAVPRRISRKHGAIMIAVAGVCVGGYFVFHSLGWNKQAVTDDRPRTISQLAAFEPAKVQKVNMQTNLGSAPPPKSFVQQQVATVDPLAAARQAPLVPGLTMQQQGKGRSDVVQAAANGPASLEGQSESELSSKLHATILEGSKATILRHPQFTVTMGTLIPCTLLTAMDSSAPGIVTCITQQDTLGTTGSVVLLERGTKMVGEYSSHMTQGQSRMFVLWNRAETPKHVIITLGSPGADALGRAGFDGWIDNHFWQRFGGALMLTFIDGAFSVATSLASKEGSTSLNFGTTSSAVDEALRNTINIPPTMHKNQGETVSVMTARDLDFSSVYALTMRSGQ